MTYFQFIKAVPERLSELYAPQEGRKIAFRLLLDLLGISKEFFALNSMENIPSIDEALLLRAVEQMIKGAPLQYVTGFEMFRNHKFFVEEGVLIPRPETEELVEWILEEAISSSQNSVTSGEESLLIFDAACGSGAIGISIASDLLCTKVFACDFSDKAISVSARNADFLLGKGHTDRYKLFKCDLLEEGVVEAYLPKDKLDIIVSNPPYVCESEKRFIRPNVLFYEPFEALFVEDKNPLLFYERIADIAAYSLKPGGRLYFEINERFPSEVANMLVDKGFRGVDVRKDFRGKERMVRVFKI